MRRTSLWMILSGLAISFSFATDLIAEPLPFNSKIEVYRDKEGDVMAFALRLEQPFLAEEFEKSNYLRLTSLDRGSYLIYPKETKFRQKHAEFYGRLRGAGKAKLRLSYEIVSENLDGSRKVDVRQAEFEVPVPRAEKGPRSVYLQWAQKQNENFLDLLSYYPNETFFQYVLLQSQDRYGVTPPNLGWAMPSQEQIETGLYYTFSGGLNLQKSLQRQTLKAGTTVGDLNVHISQLSPPAVRSLPYEALLKEKREQGVEPKVHEITKLIPSDQYMLHFKSMRSAEELRKVATSWINSLLRLVTVGAREHHLSDKFEDQLCLQRDSLAKLFREKAVSELVLTGTDIFLAEGSDLTIILRVEKPEAFQKAAGEWLTEVKGRYPGLLEREFNYRGHKVSARYTSDRMVSSFVVKTDDYAVFSNSHRAIRNVVDTAIGASPNLRDALDYRYVSTILPPSEDPKGGHFFASEAFLKRLVSPAVKVSEKRRLQCFNNLIMLNNASLFYRLEHGKSPASLTDLVEGKFVDPSKLVCPHGGAYAFDDVQDTCTCSLHNRIKYLTPNVELNVLRVSTREKAEYNRYKARYESFWKKVFNPLAARITVAPTLKLEVAVLPFANSSLYGDLRGWLDEEPQTMHPAAIARSAVASLELVPGRKKVRDFLRGLPGVPEVLDMDPTLTDLSWIGDKVSVHFCDDDTVLEIDPALLRPLTLFGNISVFQQSLVATIIYGTSLPLYATIDIEDEEKARRLLKQLAARIFLKGANMGGLETNLDSYRLPDYEGHQVYVLSYQLYAVKIRLYISLVRGQLVAATRLPTLQDVIDVSDTERPEDKRTAHLLFRWNHRALKLLKPELEIYWAEKARQACHRNIMSIYNLVKLYETPVGEVDKLSDAKYGVTYFCPDGGEYRYEAKRDRVSCTAHGNRRDARQSIPPEGLSSFARFMRSMKEVLVTLRFNEDSLIATIEIERGPESTQNPETPENTKNTENREKQ